MFNFKRFGHQSRFLGPLPAVCFSAPPENGHLLLSFISYDVVPGDVLFPFFLKLELISNDKLE
jgi:hypothetical protein